jgi:hypothetical protein
VKTLVTNPVAPASLVRLDWDSNHFGFPVARIAPQIDDDDLAQALSAAHRQRVRLVYWATSAERRAPAAILSTFNGLLADRKVTFARPLADADDLCNAGGNLQVGSYGVQPSNAELIGLAIAAGAYSRFSVDAASGSNAASAAKSPAMCWSRASKRPAPSWRA